MRVIIILALCLVATQAFNFGGIISKAKSAFNSAVSNANSAVHNAESQVNSAVHNAESQVNSKIHSAESKLNSAYSKALSQANNVVSQAQNVASSVEHDITNEAQNILQQAEDIADQLHIAPTCPEAILENVQLLLQIYQVSQDPTSIFAKWNTMVEELYNICVGCTGNEAEFQWMKEIVLTQGDMEVIECGTSIVDFAVDCGQLATIADDVNIGLIKGFVSSIEGIAKTCPSAINYINQNGLGN